MKTSIIFVFCILGTTSFNLQPRSRNAYGQEVMFVEEVVDISNGYYNGYMAHRLNNGVKISTWQRISCWVTVLFGRICPSQNIIIGAVKKVVTETPGDNGILLDDKAALPQTITKPETVIAKGFSNLAVGKKSMQSSTLEKFGAELALDDKKDPANTKIIKNIAGDNFLWYQLDLKSPYAVQSIEIYDELSGYINILVSNEDIGGPLVKTLFNPGNDSICVFNSSSEYAADKGKYKFYCDTVVVGRYVNFQVLCKDGSGDCKGAKKITDVNVVGMLWNSDKSVMSVLKNVALNKPVKQSSQLETYKPENAVDGNYENAQLTATDDFFTWWRVDLGEIHMVSEVIVFTTLDYYLQFHDVTIRVSNKDISETQLKTRFEPFEPSVCVEDSAKDGPIQGGKDTIKCAHPLLGRYVSLQIISDCKGGWGGLSGAKGCNMGAGEKQHILHMAEVEVMGIPWKSTPVHVKGADKIFKTFDTTRWKEFNDMLMEEKPTCSITDIYASSMFPWWRVDLEKESEVGEVIFVNRLPPLHGMLHNIEIRVGNEDIATGNNTFKQWTENTLCLQEVEFVKEGKNAFSCESKPKGRFVSIQITKKCSDDNCFMKDANVLSLCDVEVVGV